MTLSTTLRIEDTEIVSLECPRLDESSGVEVLELVAACLRRGARSVVLDFTGGSIVDSRGARAIGAACEKLGVDGRLYLSGLSGRTRGLLRGVCAAPHLHFVSRWSDVVSTAHAA